MNLDQVRGLKASFDAHPESEEKELIRTGTEMAKGFLAENLPALSDADRAAVAWYVSKLLSGLLSTPVRKIGDVMLDSATAYGMATVDLLGWNETEGQ